MEAPTRTLPRDVFMYLLMVIALGVTAVNVGTLLFQYINLAVPDPAAGSYATDSARGLIRWSVSSLVIFFPVLAWVTRFTGRDTKAHPEKRELKVRRWLLYFTLFVAGLILIGDAVALVYTFLQGDLTLRFVLKVISILLVAGTVFSYYLRQLHDPARSILLGRLAAGAVGVVLVAGFWLAGSPSSQYHMRLDQQRAGDLQSLEYQLINYWQSKGALPATLDGLRDGTIGGFTVPRDPLTGDAYGYRILGARSYELCATFDLPSQDDSRSMAPQGMFSAWDHDAGYQCFQGTIDPQRYPVTKPRPL